jgi:hypothetical protein
VKKNFKNESITFSQSSKLFSPSTPKGMRSFIPEKKSKKKESKKEEIKESKQILKMEIEECEEDSNDSDMFMDREFTNEKVSEDLSLNSFSHDIDFNFSSTQEQKIEEEKLKIKEEKKVKEKHLFRMEKESNERSRSEEKKKFIEEDKKLNEEKSKKEMEKKSIEKLATSFNGIVRLQESNGSWKKSKDLFGFLNFSESKFKNDSINENVFMTALVIYILRKNFSVFKDEFELLVDKAIDWIDENNSNYDDLLNLIEKL